jgi:aryl-alcohol dehydrogenase-like predicted oxidoreductase
LPLAGGFLSGKCERADPDDPEAVEAPDGTRGGFDGHYLSERGWHVLNEIRSIAEEVGATPAQVSLRWVTDWDEFTCVPILGAPTVGQLDESVVATGVDVSDR